MRGAGTDGECGRLRTAAAQTFVFAPRLPCPAGNRANTEGSLHQTNTPVPFICVHARDARGYAHLCRILTRTPLIILPDVNQSEKQFTAEPGPAIRVGLMQVEGMAEAEIEAVVGERQREGPFSSLAEF